jgi:hypothetical protein
MRGPDAGAFDSEQSFQDALTAAHRAHVDQLVGMLRDDMRTVPSEDAEYDPDYYNRVDAMITLKQQQLAQFRRQVTELKEQFKPSRQ